MSTLETIHRFQCMVEDSCPLYVTADSDFGPFMVLVDYYPIFLNASMIAVSVYHYELYFFLLSLVLAFDWFLNWLLHIAIGSGSRFPGCGGANEMPSFSSQHAVCLGVMIFTFFMLWCETHVRVHRLIMINFGIFIAVLARVYIGINTPQELMVGALIGATEGVIIQWILYRYLIPMSDALLNKKYALIELTKIANTLCSHSKRRYVNVKKEYRNKENM
jgi:hypothetical protein